MSNIDNDASISDLKNFVESHSHGCQKLRIHLELPTKTYAFLQFENTTQAAAVIAKMNNAVFKGRALCVYQAQAPGDLESNSDADAVAVVAA